jgi:precorrin-4/cobalt-precorrin-4 C11-methyltransferase
MSEPSLPPVQIVGAGPGAPDLLTLRAAAAIQQAQVLLWTDSLVNPRIAALAPPECEKIGTSTLTLEEVMEALVQRARAGLRVVRLHDGDPCLYGAVAEQISRLADAGLEVEVVPGLSAYQATAAALGSELTLPGVVQTIVLSRAGGRTGMPEGESLGRLAALGASLCLYLSAPATWRRWSGSSSCTTARKRPLPLAIASAGRISGFRWFPCTRWPPPAGSGA